MHSLHLSYSASSFSSCLRRCPTCLSIEGSLTWVFYIYIYIFSKSLRGWRLHRGVAGVLVSKITNQRPQFSRLLEHVVQKLLQSNLRLGHGNGYLGQVGPKKNGRSKEIWRYQIAVYYILLSCYISRAGSRFSPTLAVLASCCCDACGVSTGEAASAASLSFKSSSFLKALASISGALAAWKGKASYIKFI